MQQKREQSTFNSRSGNKHNPCSECQNGRGRSSTETPKGHFSRAHQGEKRRPPYCHGIMRD